MKIKKNRIKSKLDGFNVWEITTSVCEILIILTVLIAIGLYTNEYMNDLNIKKS